MLKTEEQKIELLNKVIANTLPNCLPHHLQNVRELASLIALYCGDEWASEDTMIFNFDNYKITVYHDGRAMDRSKSEEDTFWKGFIKGKEDEWTRDKLVRQLKHADKRISELMSENEGLRKEVNFANFQNGAAQEELEKVVPILMERDQAKRDAQYFRERCEKMSEEVSRLNDSLRRKHDENEHLKRLLKEAYVKSNNIQE